MREALLDVLIDPSVARQGAYYRSSEDDGPKVVIVQDVYSSEEAQRRIPEVCRCLVHGAGVRLIAIEGEFGPILLQSESSSPEQVRSQFSGMSAAVTDTLLLRLEGVTFEGIDELTSFQSARQAQAYLTENIRAIRHRLAPILDAVADTQSIYPEEIGELRRSLLPFRRKRLPLSREVELVKLAAARHGVDLTPLSNLGIFARALELERSIDFDAAAQQREVLQRKFLREIEQVLRVDVRGHISERCLAFLQFWMNKFGLTPEDVHRSVQLRGLATVVEECKRALLIRLARIVAGGQMEDTYMAGGYAAMVSDFIEILEALDVDTADMPDIKTYGEYFRLTKEGLGAAALFREMPHWSHILIDGLRSPDASEACRIEDELERVYLALHLELTPEAAEKVDLNVKGLAELLERLARLRATLGKDEPAPDVTGLQPALDAAAQFYRNSLGRGKIMADNIIALLQRHPTDRMIVLAGGFHPRTITTALENESSISWSVVAPTLDNVSGARGEPV